MKLSCVPWQIQYCSRSSRPSQRCWTIGYCWTFCLDQIHVYQATNMEQELQCETTVHTSFVFDDFHSEEAQKHNTNQQSGNYFLKHGELSSSLIMKSENSPVNQQKLSENSYKHANKTTAQSHLIWHLIIIYCNHAVR